MGSLESDTTERLHFHFSLSCIGEGNGNPLQLPAESQGREAWWAAVYGVAQSRTRLKRLSSSSSSKGVRYTRSRCLAGGMDIFFLYSSISIDLPEGIQLVSCRDEVKDRREED